MARSKKIAGFTVTHHTTKKKEKPIDDEWIDISKRAYIIFLRSLSYNDLEKLYELDDTGLDLTSDWRKLVSDEMLRR